jgi:hypothetical protein
MTPEMVEQCESSATERTLVCRYGTDDGFSNGKIIVDTEKAVWRVGRIQKWNLVGFFTFLSMASNIVGFYSPKGERLLFKYIDVFNAVCVPCV